MDLLELLQLIEVDEVGSLSNTNLNIFAKPPVIDYLVDGIFAPDPAIRVRTARAVEKISEKRADLLIPVIDRLIREMGAVNQTEIRQSFSRIATRLLLTPGQLRTVRQILESSLANPNPTIQTTAQQALTELSTRHA